VASSPAFLNHCQGAPKRSGGGIVVVLVLDLLGFCVEKRSDVSAIILFCHYDTATPTDSTTTSTRHLSWSVKVLAKFYSQFFRGYSQLCRRVEVSSGGGRKL